MDDSIIDSEYEATIGLEIHAELRTSTKMFCRSKNDPDAQQPNINICPVCLAHPGTLPVVNHDAVRHVLRVGSALGSSLADYTEFDRKNYFYPDLPKGYQISQYEYPLVSGGELAGVHITRIHLEEDTASSIHEDSTGTTLIDYNRSGVPLMELVTEPEMHSAAEAGRFARELQLLLRYLGASDANMEKGEMRVEANVSVAKRGERSSIYVEIKNLNSFRTMEKAVEYEIKRQTKLLKEGKMLEKQTLGWDEAKQATFPQRNKEGSADYRYFPDPDIPSLRLSEIAEFSTEAIAATLPELPDMRRKRYERFGIKQVDAEQFARDTQLGDFMDALLAETQEGDKELVSIASNYLANDVANIIRDSESRDSNLCPQIAISPKKFFEICRLLKDKKISSRSAKDVLAEVWGTDMDPVSVIESRGLIIKKDSGVMAKTIDLILSENTTVVSDYKAGKMTALEYLVGQGMRILRGAADPAELREEIRKALER